MLKFASLLGASLILVTGRLSADVLPPPVLLRADPQMIYPGTPGWLDSNGRILVIIYGENLAPSDLDHPSGPDAGYQHVYVRGVSPKGDRVTDWVPATADNGVQMYGAAVTSFIQMGVDPARFLSEPGSHMQVKLWVSMSATSQEPGQGTAGFSGWSPIKTIDVAPAGATKPQPPPSPAASLSRVVPNDIVLMPSGTNYRLKLYGQHISGVDLQVVFNGDVAGAVPAEDRARAYEDDNSFVPGGDELFHVTIPEKYRRTNPGTLRVALKVASEAAVSREKTITFSYPARVPAGVPQIAAMPKPALVVPVGTGVVHLPATISRIAPTGFRVGDRAATYRLRVYVNQMSGEGAKVVFDGDEAGAVPAEDRARNVDDDGTPLKDGERMFHVTVPEKHRRSTPGVVSVVAVQGSARTAPAQLDFTAMVIRPMAIPIQAVPQTPAVPRPPMPGPKR